jgi:hypothetical protein
MLNFEIIIRNKDGIVQWPRLKGSKINGGIYLLMNKYCFPLIFISRYFVYSSVLNI